MPTKKKKSKKKSRVKTIIGGHYDRISHDDVNQTSSPDYQELFRTQCDKTDTIIREYEKEKQHDRYKAITNLVDSIATINRSLATVIGELGGGRI